MIGSKVRSSLRRSITDAVVVDVYKATISCVKHMMNHKMSELLACHIPYTVRTRFGRTLQLHCKLRLLSRYVVCCLSVTCIVTKRLKLGSQHNVSTFWQYV